GDVLQFSDQFNIHFVSYNSGTGVLTLSGIDTQAHYQTALQSVTFNNPGDDPANGGLDTSRTITWQVDDGSGAGNNNLSSPSATKINITAINDAPTNTVPGPQSVNEDNALTITGLSVSDPDIGANPITVTLTVASGTVHVLDNVAGGLTAGGIGGNDSTTVTL